MVFSSLFFKEIGHLYDDIILLLRPESFRVLLSCANYGFCYSNLTGIRKFKYERKNEKDSGRSSKITPSCKWPIGKSGTKGHGSMFASAKGKQQN